MRFKLAKKAGGGLRVAITVRSDIHCPFFTALFYIWVSVQVSRATRLEWVHSSQSHLQKKGWQGNGFGIARDRSKRNQDRSRLNGIRIVMN